MEGGATCVAVGLARLTGGLYFSKGSRSPPRRAGLARMAGLLCANQMERAGCQQSTGNGDADDDVLNYSFEVLHLLSP
jgi:hypothetical protein